MIKFDENYHVQDYTFILAKRNHDHLGEIKNVSEVISKINMNSANEISFTVSKYSDEEQNKVEPLWNEITDFKYVFVKELNEYYEIVVSLNEEDITYKTITGSSACECELSQSYVYNLEINTELDIAREEYKSPTLFYNPNYPDQSLLNRVLYKLPQYSIDHVDSSLLKIQRSFSADGENVYSLLTGTIAEEVGCLFTFDSVNRTISAYDLKSVCIDCGHRGEFSDVCPKCGSDAIQYYGDDTTIYIDTENLAEGVTFETDTESVKNCFKLEAGDDNMTSAVINCNPNGSSYIYYFSDEQKHDMGKELVDKLDSYDALVESYNEEYSKVMADMYEAIDKIVYYTSEMMPERENSPTSAAQETAKLTQDNLSPMSLPEVTRSTSVSTVNTALKNYAKVYVKSGYFKIDIEEGQFAYEGTAGNDVHYGIWYGKLKVTNYSDEEDVAITDYLRIVVDDNYKTFLEQKIQKKLITDKDEDGSIFDVLSIKELDKFKEALPLYGLNRLISFNDAIQGVIDIMIEADQSHENSDLYDELYVPYYEKLVATQEEMDKRTATIKTYEVALETTQTRQREIQKILNFEAYLGEKLYLEFCCYKREDTYSNENYISDGFENNEIFERANAFLEVAKEELIKSGEHQHSISSSLINLLAMKEFEALKDKFVVGNFIRIGVDGVVYRLRLVSYQIAFDNIQNIDVEFSDVLKIKSGTSDFESIMSKASSMASSYDAVTNQVKNSKEQTDMIKNWTQTGLDATNMKIVNSASNQNITIGESGLLARRKDDFTERYEPYQIKLLSNGLYITDNNWRTTSCAVGKFYLKDPVTGKTELKYGVLAENLVGQLILGNALGIYSEDGGASMSFDNFGLRLNTTDNGTGAYRRILDIQKDGVSQLYIDSDGNIVLATNQFIQTVEALDRLNALYADIENLYVSNATIENLLAEYAKIENLKALEAEFGTVVATEAEIEDLKAGSVTIAGKLIAQDAEIETLKATSIDVGDLEAFKATIENLFALYATIEHLEANYIKTAQIEATYAKISQLDVVTGNIENLNATVANINKLIANKADIEELNAINAKITNLTADLANIDKLVANKVDAEYVQAEIAKIDKIITEDLEALHAIVDVLDAKYATIEQLNAKVAEINLLIAKKASIEELNTAKAEIGELNAGLANINSILAGNIGTGLLQTIHLTASNVVIDDAIIKSAMIADLDVNKLKAGTISTDKFTVASDDGRMQIVGSTQQFTDENGKVRLQIGKDAQGNFNFIVFGEDGTTAIYDENGITSRAVPDGLIVDKMVADNANISGDKLNINSVVEKINEDGTTTINSNKIWISEENQSLGAKFISIEESIGGTNTDLSNFITQTSKDLDSLQGQIDGSIQTYFYGYVPTNTNIPASDWNTTDLKNNHLGDLFYNTVTGYCYRWQVINNAYSWQRITDVDVTKALADASKAQDTADNKRRVFVTTPTTPYDVGDLWSQGTNGDLMACKVAKTASQTYASTDWEKASKYTDDTKANAVDKKVTTLQTEFTVEQGKISSLISETETLTETVSTVETIANQAKTTATTANTTATEAKNTANTAKTTADTAKSTADTAKTTATNAQNVANTKRRNFTSQPTPPYDVGDLWSQGASGEQMVCKTARASGSYTASDWQKASKYTDDTKANSVQSSLTTLTNRYNQTEQTVAGNTTTIGNISTTVDDLTNDVVAMDSRIAEVKLTADGVNTTVSANKTKWDTASTDATNAKTVANQTAEKFTWLVKSGTSASNFELTDRVASLTAEKINFNGLVTFNGLATDAQNKINTATSNASTALTTANTAKSTADTAKSTATTAKSTADTAKTTADSAKTTATTANTNASTALSTANTAKTTADSANTKATNAQTLANNATLLAQAMTRGKCMIPDVDFRSDINGVGLYRHSATDGTKVATLTRISKPSDCPTTSTHCLELDLTGLSSTGSLGGFVQSIQSRNGAIFVQRFVAKLPIGYRFNTASNSMGTGYTDKFVTSIDGTGKYQEYLRLITCGTGGTFSNGGHVYITGSPTPTTSAPVKIYLASCTYYDITDANPVDAWTSDAVINGTTTINGGYIRSHTIGTNQLIVEDIFATGSSVMNIISARELNANLITSGEIKSNLLNVYGLKVLQTDTNIETLTIDNIGNVVMRGTFESYNYHDGKKGWSIKSDGSAEFNELFARGSIITNDAGIVSAGGIGRNLLLNSGLDIDTTGWSNGGYSVVEHDGYKCCKVTGELTKTKLLSQSIINRIKKDTTTHYVVSGWVKCDNYIAGTTNPFCSLYFSGSYNNAGTSTWLGSVTVGGSSSISGINNKGWTYMTWIVRFAQVPTDMGFYVYCRDFTGDVYVRNLKIEEGDIATEWSLAPEDTIKQVRFWAGTTYENRDYAPFRVYNNGEVIATKGIYSGLWTGEIKVGNISILDPSEVTGNDAIVTIQNGNNGVKRVQLRDTDVSSFAQDIDITNNTGTSMIRLNQNGTSVFTGMLQGTTGRFMDELFIGSNVKLYSNSTETLYSTGNLYVGDTENKRNLTVGGNINALQNITVGKEISFNDIISCEISPNGIDFNFVN